MAFRQHFNSATFNKLVSYRRAIYHALEVSAAQGWAWVDEEPGEAAGLRGGPWGAGRDALCSARPTQLSRQSQGVAGAGGGAAAGKRGVCSARVPAELGVGWGGWGRASQPMGSWGA